MSARRILGMMAAVGLCARIATADVLSVGEQFPDWQLVSHTGADVTSMSFLGRSYIVWFYPAAMTPGCTAEGRAFKEQYEAFGDAGVEVLGVSFDPPETNAAFVDSEGFPFELLSDTSRSLALAVGAADSSHQPRPRRISYLVGKDGRVVKAYTEVQPLRHAREILLDLGVVEP